MTGKTSYLSGLCAETAVERLFTRQGSTIAARRWRGVSGEIDLVVRTEARVIFVEVKKARTHAIAAERLCQRQMARIYSAGSEYLSGEPGGALTEVRFDVALVDALGRIEIVDNAFSG